MNHTASPRRRVAITGLGAVTPVGNSAAATWAALIAGRSGIGRITRFDPTDCAAQIAGEVRGSIRQCHSRNRCTRTVRLANR